MPIQFFLFCNFVIISLISSKYLAGNDHFIYFYIFFIPEMIG